MTKICRKLDCAFYGEEQPAENFYAGYTCKTCHKKKVKSWQRANKDKVSCYKEKWNESNPDYAKIYYSENRDLIVERASEWNRTNSDRARANSKASRSRHKDKQRLKCQKRRAIKKGLHTETFLDHEIFERDNWICQLCYRPVNPELKWPDPESKSLDHIIPLTCEGSSHTRENVQLAHFKCNSSKGNRL